MLVLALRYLNGFVAAAEPDSLERVEWPPHPGRVFMALAAAHFATAGDENERRVLQWLASLPPPLLRTPNVSQRALVTHYVPVNDKAGEPTRPPTAIIQSAPQLARDRQPRTFARGWLEGDDTVLLVWPDVSPDDETRAVLDLLCRKVTRVGHSTSLVHMWVADPDTLVQPTWVPDNTRAEIYLRVASEGLLDALERDYNAEEIIAYTTLLVTAETAIDRRESQRARQDLRQRFGDFPPEHRRPSITRYQGYARRESEQRSQKGVGTTFDARLVVFALERKASVFDSLGLVAAPQVMSCWRAALLSRCGHDVSELRVLVSGHDADGSPTENPHVALVPLAFVGHRHATGRLVGVAALIPSGLDTDIRRQLLRLLGSVTELRLGPLGVWTLNRELSDRPMWNLRAEAWTAYPEGALHWASVTPIAFDRHPKAKSPAAYESECREMVETACQAIGLPKPRDVVMTQVSPHLGAATSAEFPPLLRKDGSRRRHSHVILTFDEPVCGPITLGAGRYRGYGWCRPLWPS